MRIVQKSIGWLLVGMALLNPVLVKAQSSDFFRSIGKIYVVVAVILAIFFGIVAFLVFLDRKLTRIENQIKENE